MKKAEWYELQARIFNDIMELTRKKNQDYTAGSDDAFANFRLAEQIGQDPLVGLVLRMGDKWQRILSYLRSGELAVTGEGLEDAFSDMIGYSAIAIGLMKEKERNNANIQR